MIVSFCPGGCVTRASVLSVTGGPPGFLLRVAGMCKSVLLLDHHKTVSSIALCCRDALSASLVVAQRVAAQAIEMVDALKKEAKLPSNGEPLSVGLGVRVCCLLRADFC